MQFLLNFSFERVIIQRGNKIWKWGKRNERYMHKERTKSMGINQIIDLFGGVWVKCWKSRASSFQVNEFVLVLEFWLALIVLPFKFQISTDLFFLMDFCFFFSLGYFYVWWMIESVWYLKIIINIFLESLTYTHNNFNKIIFNW